MRLPLRPALRRAADAAALALCLGAAACGDGVRETRAAAPVASPVAAVAVARGVVELPGGLLELAPARDGVVDSVEVREGDHVQRGQVLLRLVATPLRAELDVAEAEASLARAREQAQAARLPALRRQAARLGEAARADAIEPQRAEEAEQAAADGEAAWRVAAAEAEVARKRLAQARSQWPQLSLAAPVGGTVIRLHAQPGLRLAAAGGRPAMVLLPDGALRVRAEVNEAYLGRIALGMRATVHLDTEADGASASALPPARVVRISPLFGPVRLDDELPQRASARVVECLLEFDQPASVRVGQAVRVDFTR
jgi:multidrug efflux pump subunit AcrA (membrane-fusion protein)